MIYRFETEFPPVQTRRLKIEINTREHFTVLGFEKIPFTVNSRWFSGSCKITTYKLEELTGTKLRALYQRNKGRDMYDLYKIITNNPGLNIELSVRCFQTYIKHTAGSVPTKEIYLKNIEEKMHDPEFTGDIAGLLKPGEKWNPRQAYDTVKNEILDKI